MVASIYSPFSFLSIPSRVAKQPTHQQQQRTHELLIKNQSHPANSQPQHRTRAFDDAINIAADTTTAPHRGNISVLIPVSSVLLFMYWIANFVVAEMVSKDLQRKASEGEEKPEAGGEEKPQVEKTFSEASQPRRKMKKADLKKMIKTKMDRGV